MFKIVCITNSCFPVLILSFITINIENVSVIWKNYNLINLHSLIKTIINCSASVNKNN